MLMANKSRALHGIVGFQFAGVSLNQPNLCAGVGNMRFGLAAFAEFSDLASIPQGLTAKKNWLPALTSGAITSFKQCRLTVDARASAAVGQPISGTADMTISGRGAMLLSLPMSASGSITVTGRASASTVLAISGTAVVTISGRGIAGQIQHASGSAVLEISGRAAPLIVLHMSGTTAEAGLTPNGIARAVWSAAADTNNSPGSMGEKVNAAGAAADPWATPEGQSVLNNTGLVPATV